MLPSNALSASLTTTDADVYSICGYSQSTNGLLTCNKTLCSNIIPICLIKIQSTNSQVPIFLPLQLNYNKTIPKAITDSTQLNSTHLKHLKGGLRRPRFVWPEVLFVATCPCGFAMKTEGIKKNITKLQYTCYIVHSVVLTNAVWCSTFVIGRPSRH